mmetsp:Transcript_23028/g.47107  ORF Transcript_23028/g.47107 Transcript_23028/m.47107 type:complete len:80 (+) Transcript_23028:1333-1572(+)
MCLAATSKAEVAVARHYLDGGTMQVHMLGMAHMLVPVLVHMLVLAHMTVLGMVHMLVPVLARMPALGVLAASCLGCARD